MKRLFLLAWLIPVISVLALGSPACFPTSTGTSTTSEMPTIVAFSATPTEITEGESATLMWNVTNATSIQIDQGVGSGLAAAGTSSVSPSSSTTYTLTAGNSAGSSTQFVTVTVTEAASTPTTPPPALPPNIVVFDIAPNIIHHPPGPGPNNATMRWEVKNATTVTINGITEPHIGSRVLSPSLGTHTYTLRAINANDAVTKTQVLKVIP
jgi:hypothetical protein